MADPIVLLREQQEKRLLDLGKQRQARQQRLANLTQRQAQLEGLIEEYSGSGNHASALLMSNRSQMNQQLRPMVEQCLRQQAVAQQDLSQIDGQWQKQLGRRQGLVWLEQENARSEQQRAQRREQKQMDEFAQRRVRSR
ncbi:flagellar export protein FliJ [Ferrimonas marina]|uniref:Flagellar FliJ protein n=1 Tax=Ferrimonas marina TaxID=299255 RepID=A0A1M5R0C3_9GAMM|nr:flagellar export protein FliJ [Ferrimonas marina]SHH19802.1 flagellar export protein FliJ [Ferrimonas marina]